MGPKQASKKVHLADMEYSVHIIRKHSELQGIYNIF